MLSVIAVLAWAGAAAAGPSPAPKSAAAPDAAAPLPIGAFYKPAAASGARLSPSGKLIAIFRQAGDASGVVVYDVADQTVKAIYGQNDKNLHFDWIRWKSDKRLIVGVTYFRIARADARPNAPIVDLRYVRFILAIDADGGNSVILLQRNIQRSASKVFALDLLDTLRDDPDHILAVAPSETGRPTVWRTDIRTGIAQAIETGDDQTIGWDTDNSGALVARLEQRGRDMVIQGRAPGEKTWSEVTRVRPKEFKALGDFEFLGATSSPAQLYVAVKPETPAQGSARTVRVYDFKSHSLGPPLWPALNYDVANIVTDEDTNELLGVCYWIDVYQCDFKNAEVQANFRAIEKFYKGDRSLLLISRSDDARWWLFLVSGPDEPASYYLFDWRAKAMRWLGGLYPDLPPEKLGAMTRFTYKARDGVEIPAYLTRPPGAPAGPLPLVVLPHGGPEARDNFDFDTWSQIIATRGYLVLQPNFRGSGGYGVAYAESGYGQWGAKMQDDITDGVAALVKSGQVDPSRICIFGASYGGYAALTGGALRPDLYKCVVSWAGIADLQKFLKFKRGGLFVGERSPAYDYWVKAIGDPDADKARLTHASAITYASKYGPPVLLIHGADDTNVPVNQSQDMDQALRSAGRDVKLVVIPGEDHTDWSPEHEQAAISDVVDFITAHITPARLAPVVAAPAADASH
jgi:dienelactone hydrolase